MKRQGYVFIVLLLSCCFTASANAQGKAGWAVSGGIGVSQIKDRDGTEKFDANAIGLILGGEYRFNEHFALGLNGFGLGTAEDMFNAVETEIQVKGFDLIGRLILPVTQSAELFFLAGTAAYYADLDPGFSSPFGEDAIEFGIGADFGNADGFAFRVAGRYFDGPRDESGALLTVGFNYRF